MVYANKMEDNFTGALNFCLVYFWAGKTQAKPKPRFIWACYLCFVDMLRQSFHIILKKVMIIQLYIIILFMMSWFSFFYWFVFIHPVESNDTLYGGSPEYMSELLSFIDKLIEEILAQLALIGERTDITVYILLYVQQSNIYCQYFYLEVLVLFFNQSRKQQGTLALDFVNILIAMIVMNSTSATLVVKLFGLAKKSGAVDPVYTSSTLLHIQTKPGVWFQDLALKLAAMWSHFVERSSFQIESVLYIN